MSTDIAKKILKIIYNITLIVILAHGAIMDFLHRISLMYLLFILEYFEYVFKHSFHTSISDTHLLDRNKSFMLDIRYIL